MKRKREENNKKTSQSYDIHIPSDLMVEILSRLPVKSLVRFQSVSKLWSSLITDSIMTWSLAKPRLLVILDHKFLQSLEFSLSGDLLNTYKESERAGFHTFNCNVTYQYTRGLLCCMSSSDRFLIYNLTTRQPVLLPKISKLPRSFIDGFFGYDPIENQYKVLCMNRGLNRLQDSYQVFTLGDPNKQWRNIRGFGPYFSPTMTTRVCINGKIYFRASLGRYPYIPQPNASGNVLLSFDVRSERFNHVEIPNQCRSLTLVNYQGKLGCIRHSFFAVEMWVMDQGEKQEWSKNIFSMPGIVMDSVGDSARIVGVTLNGEVVIMPKKLDHRGETLYAYFYDPKQNNTRRVDFKRNFKEELKYQTGFGVFSVPDHVENPMSLLDSFH